jgi:hypothetical protein
VPQYNEIESLFAKHFVQSATLCSLECHCGRVHFVSARGHGDYAPEELERLKELAVAKPERYIEESDFDSIDYVQIQGHQIVMHCDCGRAAALAADQCAGLLVELLTQRARTAADKERNCRELSAKLSLWPSHSDQ